ncbi:MAG: hypothetical protein ACOYKZ_03885 [Chlamydiia bacterium]
MVLLVCDGAAVLLPAGGFRLVAFRQAAEKKQASAFFGLRAGFPTLLQLEGGYAFTAFIFYHRH